MSAIIDNGPSPLVCPVEKLAIENENYRTTLWTGSYLQVTLMSITPGHDIGLEVHEHVDQFLRIEQGKANVFLGPDMNELNMQQAGDGDAIIVPAGTWHNLVNSGEVDLKVYSIYSPVQHPHGTIHATKEAADAAEISE
jgi:mannose-6-phosphate isomerase-like protein (cupin superfamily)